MNNNTYKKGEEIVAILPFTKNRIQILRDEIMELDTKKKQKFQKVIMTKNG